MATKKKSTATVPGILIECKSGRYLAYYEHRTDIIAHGENEKDAKRNLKKMYEVVRKHEESESDTDELILPKSYHKKQFSEKLASL